MRVKTLKIGNYQIDFNIGGRNIDVYRFGSNIVSLDVTKVRRISFKPGSSIDDPCSYVFELERQDPFIVKDLGPNNFLADETLNTINKRLGEMYQALY